MRPSALFACLTLALSGWLSAAPQQPKPFTAATNLVVVPVVVVDGKGRTIPHLTAADFQITEDGEPVAIDTFIPPAADASGPNDGRFIVLVLDNCALRPSSPSGCEGSPTASSIAWARST